MNDSGKEKEERAVQLPVDLRDYFAAKALQGAISAEQKPLLFGKRIDTSREFAKYAYAMADAMLAERAK